MRLPACRRWTTTWCAALIVAALSMWGRGASADGGDPSRSDAHWAVAGDIRLRHETDTDLESGPARNRERVRARLEAKANLGDELEAGLRLTTGDRSAPASPHQTLGSGFSRFEINLDRVYLTYRPKHVAGLALTGGKFAHLLWTNPIYGELVWDADIQPEGAAVRFDSPQERAVAISFTAAGYVLLEQATAREATALVVQGGVRARLATGLEATLALGFHDYSDLEPDGSQALVQRNRGNAVAGPPGALAFVSRFQIVHPTAALGFRAFGLPAVVGGEYFVNARAGIPEDDGYAFGAALGTTKRAGDWRTYYQWQVVGQDATLSLFAQDDFLRTTGFRGHVGGVKVMLADRAELNLWTLVSARENATAADRGPYEWRIRADLNVRLPS